MLGATELPQTNICQGFASIGANLVPTERTHSRGRDSRLLYGLYREALFSGLRLHVLKSSFIIVWQDLTRLSAGRSGGPSEPSNVPTNLSKLGDSSDTNQERSLLCKWNPSMQIQYWAKASERQEPGPSLYP